MIGWIKGSKWYKNGKPLTRAIIWVVLSFLVLTSIFIPGFIFFTHLGFQSIENRDVNNKLQYSRDIIQFELNEISSLAKDKADWDATYDFVSQPDVNYSQAYFDDNALKNLNINYLAIINNSGLIVYAKTLDFSNNEIKPIVFDSVALLKKYPELIRVEDINSDGFKGLLSINNKILMVNARPILTSKNNGPSRGTFIYGRFLNQDEDQNLSKLTHFLLFTQSLDVPVNSAEMQSVRYALIGQSALPSEDLTRNPCQFCHPINPGSPSFTGSFPSYIAPVNATLMGGYSLLADIHQNPIAVLGVYIPRDIEQLEYRYALQFLLALLVLLLIIGIMGVKIIEKTMLTEEALDHEYSLMRAVIDNVPEQIYAHDVDGHYLLNNKNDALIIGVNNPEELLGKSDFDYYPLELATQFHQSEMEIIRSGHPKIDIESTIVRSDGKTHWILTTKTPLVDKKGQITGIVGVSRDITERKQRERELEVIVMMSRALRSAETSKSLLLIIYNQIVNFLRVDFGTLELIDPLTGVSQVAYSIGGGDPLKDLKIPIDQGLNRFIRASRKPYLENNLVENPMALDIEIYNGCSSVAGAPMIAEDELIGFLWIGRKTQITEEEVKLLAAMADIAASSLRRITLHELTEKRLDQLTSLRKIDISINNSKELDVNLKILLAQTLSQLKADAAEILLYNIESGNLFSEIGLGFKTKLFDHRVIPMKGTPAGQAAQNKVFIPIQNLAVLGPSHEMTKAAREEGFISYFAVPLLVRSEIKGVIELFFRYEFNPDPEWINFFETLAGQAAIAIEQAQLFQGLQSSNQELIQAYDETIEGWVRALDLRDKETEGHSLRVTEMCVKLAAFMGISGDELIHIRRGALLHDIGKVGVPDLILLKPGKLTEEEWIIMRRHPKLAYDMLSPINYLRPALIIPYCHHERWDGAGYPQRLKGEEIPLAARIFSVIDVWDALSNDRPYRKAWPAEKVMEYLKENRGSQFDPKVIDAFFTLQTQ